MAVIKTHEIIYIVQIVVEIGLLGAKESPQQLHLGREDCHRVGIWGPRGNQTDTSLPLVTMSENPRQFTGVTLSSLSEFSYKLRHEAAKDNCVICLNI